MTNTDFIIVLAWPEGEVTAAGAWYDPLFATDGKYRVGHSAIILVNSENKKLLFCTVTDDTNPITRLRKPLYRVSHSNGWGKFRGFRMLDFQKKMSAKK